MEDSKEKNCSLLLGNNGSLQELSAGCSSALKITVAAAQGGRKYMEDRVHVEVVRSPCGKLDHVYFAIYDGHGGIQASEYAREHLHENIKSEKLFYSEKDDDVLNAIRNGFLKTQQNMHKCVDEWPMTTSGYPCTAGTTASCAIFRNDKLYTGHVGDSAIMIGDSDSENAIKLTEDHKPDDKQERLRIEAAGGSIGSKAGVFRVVWKRPSRSHKGPVRRSTPTENIPFLAVARALGDFWSFNPDNNEYVVSPEPDVNVHILKPTNCFLVLASDGLTNVLPTQKVISLLRELDKNGKTFLTNLKTNDENLEPNQAQFLLQSTFNRWGILRADNVSVICVKIEHELLAAGHPSVAAEDLFMQADQILTDHHSAMIRVTSTQTQRLLTNPVRVIYQGALDRSMQPFQRIVPVDAIKSTKRSEPLYAGPGFIVPESQPKDEASSDEETYQENSNNQDILQYSFSLQNPGFVRRSFVAEYEHSLSTFDQKRADEIKTSKINKGTTIGVPTSCFVAASTSSLACSSLLSPVAMLESIRSSAAIYRSTNFISGPRSLPNSQSFMASDCSGLSHSYGLECSSSMPNSKAFSPLVTSDINRSRKRKNESLLETGLHNDDGLEREPPTKRNRIWNFFSGIFKSSPKNSCL